MLDSAPQRTPYLAISLFIDPSEAVVAVPLDTGILATTAMIFPLHPGVVL